MSKYLIFILLILGLLSPSFSQDNNKDKKEDDIAPTTSQSTELKELVKPQCRLTKRIFFVLDVSGSMKGDGQLQRAIDFVNTICQQPLDEFEIAIVVFNDTMKRWEGFPSGKDDPKPTPKGWAKLPSAEAANAAQKWLSTFPGSGNTEPNGALQEALSEARDELSIVLITDGEFNGTTKPIQSFLDTIKECQEKREKKGLGRAIIAIFGVGPGAAEQAHLGKVGKEEKGGFFVEPLKKKFVDPRSYR